MSGQCHRSRFIYTPFRGRGASKLGSDNDGLHGGKRHQGGVEHASGQSLPLYHERYPMKQYDKVQPCNRKHHSAAAMQPVTTRECVCARASVYWGGASFVCSQAGLRTGLPSLFWGFAQSGVPPDATGRWVVEPYAPAATALHCRVTAVHINFLKISTPLLYGMWDRFFLLLYSSDGSKVQPSGTSVVEGTGKGLESVPVILLLPPK